MKERASQPMTTAGYERLLHANLVRVFSERNRARRQAAIAELYAPDAVLYEPDTVALAMPPSTKPSRRCSPTSRRRLCSRPRDRSSVITAWRACAGPPDRWMGPWP